MINAHNISAKCNFTVLIIVRVRTLCKSEELQDVMLNNYIPILTIVSGKKKIHLKRALDILSAAVNGEEHVGVW